MTLSQKENYFISVRDAVMYEEASAKSEPVNHVIFGDWLRWRGESSDGWEKISCRGDLGWVRRDQFEARRVLEINFVDIGQGDGTHIVTPEDEVILIDAGKTDNMARFLSWRYNLRRRKVAGVDGVTQQTEGAKGPFQISKAVLSHPDLDHYYGFKSLFENPKISFAKVYHNGIVERPISKAEKDALKNVKNQSIFYDLGKAVKAPNGETYLVETVETNKAMRDLIKKFPKTTKKYLSTLRAAVENPANKKLKFIAVNSTDGHIEGYEETQDLQIEIQGPVPERIEHEGKKRLALRKLGGEGVTKNGHSVVLQLRIGKLKVMLGGDLNTESEDYLLRHYCGIDFDVSPLEKTLHELYSKRDSLTSQEKQALAEAETALAAVVAKARPIFQVDVAKAHHHGSHHFSETFLKAINAIAVVISSGDNEAYSHPRPDALGAFGKYGRGHRPLLFSTEIARSTREFTPIFKFFERIQKYQNDLKKAQNERERKRLTREIEKEKDRNVAVYGMITLRTDGEKVFIAQKIEMPTKNSQKWDIHELVFNEDRDEFVYHDRTKHH